MHKSQGLGCGPSFLVGTGTPVNPLQVSFHNLCHNNEFTDTECIPGGPYRIANGDTPYLEAIETERIDGDRTGTK